MWSVKAEKKGIVLERRKGVVVRFGSRNMEVVDAETGGRLICTMPGRFRLQGIRPIVGDRVEYALSGDGQGRIESILPRKTKLLRPRISNIEQILLVLSLKEPAVQNLITDRFLVLAEYAKLPVTIVVNKIDLINNEELDRFSDVYGEHYEICPVSSKYGINLDRLREVLKGKISVMAGMSGVGKSSLLNSLNPGLKLRVSEISRGLERGRHTTSYVELLQFEFGGLIADTPGFANLELPVIAPENLDKCFPEISQEQGMCAFSDCVHVDEPGCYVKELVEAGSIHRSRYESYLIMYNELKEREQEKGGRKYG